MMHLGSLVVASALLALSLAPHPASEGHPDSRHATAQEVSPPRSDSCFSRETQRTQGTRSRPSVGIFRAAGSA